MLKFLLALFSAWFLPSAPEPTSMEAEALPPAPPVPRVLSVEPRKAPPVSHPPTQPRARAAAPQASGESGDDPRAATVRSDRDGFREAEVEPQTVEPTTFLELRPEPPIQLTKGNGGSFIKSNDGSCPAWHDVDGDGRADLLLGYEDGTPIQVFRSTESGFASAVPLSKTVGEGNVPGLGETLQVVDFDGDGFDDLVCGSRDRQRTVPGYVYVARGSAEGFGRMEILCDVTGAPLTMRLNRKNIHPSTNATRPCAADLDGDGLMDLVLGSRSGDFAWFKGGPDGFGPTGAILGSPYIKVSSDSDPVLYDLDGDGDLDLVSGSGDGGVYRSWNAGTPDRPDFGPLEAWIPTPPKRFTDYPMPRIGSDWLTRPQLSTRVCIADVDGDGAMDLLVSDRHQVRVPAKGLDASLAAAQLSAYVQRWNELMDLWPVPGSPDRRIALNHWEKAIDKLEVELQRSGERSWTGGVWLYRGQSADELAQTSSGAPMNSGPTLGTRGGLQPVRRTAAPKRVRIALSPVQIAEPVRLEAQGEWIEAAGVGKANPEVDDLDGDGFLDLLVADGLGRIVVHRGGMNGFEAAQPLMNGEAPLVHPEEAGDCGASLQVVDLDRDGRKDLLVGGLGVQGSDAPRCVYWLKGRGAFQYDDYRHVLDENGDPLVVQGYSLAPFAADLNADGHLDLVVGTAAGHFRRFRGTSQGLEAEGELLASPSPEGEEEQPLKLFGGGASPRFADVDNDGDLDLISGSNLTGLYLSKNQGSPERPRFARLTQLYDLHAFKRQRGKVVKSESAAHPGVRARVCWSDVTGDGVPDLLVGDSVLVKDAKPSSMSLLGENADSGPAPSAAGAPRRTGYLWLFVGSPWVNQTGKRPTAKPRR
ncbi:MAG: FG-GAP repeat domain-containing protein [Planctomycetota bacterium]|jgi:hypothetical protein